MERRGWAGGRRPPPRVRDPRGQGEQAIHRMGTLCWTLAGWCPSRGPMLLGCIPGGTGCSGGGGGGGAQERSPHPKSCARGMHKSMGQTPNCTDPPSPGNGTSGWGVAVTPSPPPPRALDLGAGLSRPQLPPPGDCLGLSLALFLSKPSFHIVLLQVSCLFACHTPHPPGLF